MKILLTGGNGMLGRTLRHQWQDFDVVSTDLPDADITNAAGIDKIISGIKPDAVVHCAAMTAVDKCESEQETAYRLNAFGSGNVAAACYRHNVRLIAISTDYVFDGSLNRPYHEFDNANGGNTVYGQTKFAGEELIRRYMPNHVIARISWLYGAGGPSFVHAMMALADGSRPELKVVNDQIGNPTSTLAVAEGLRSILLTPEVVGTVHLTCEGEATWFDFAQEIFRLAGKSQKVIPCKTSEFPRPAPRPANSRLEKRMLKFYGLPAMPDWHEALREFMSEEF